MTHRRETFKKNRNNLRNLFLILAIPFVVTCLFCWVNFHTPVIFVKENVADTTEYAPEDGPYVLTGQWLRYAGGFQPEDLAGMTGEYVRDISYIRKMSGYTYRFTLKMEELSEWSFLLPRPHGSRLWMNGTEVIGESGLSSADIYHFEDYTEKTDVEVVLQVTNASIYDVYQGIMIGSKASLAAVQTHWMILDLVAAGMSLMLVFMCLGMFFPKRSETYLVWLALSALSEVAHFMMIARHPALSFLRIGSPTFYRQLGFINYFVCKQFVPVKNERRLDRWVLAVILITMVGCILWPERSNEWMRMSYLFYLTIQAWILGGGVLQQIPAARIIMTGCMLVFGNELFYQLLYAGVIPQGRIDIEIMPAQYMRFAYISTLALATCMKYGKKFEEAEQLTEDLERKVEEQTEELRHTNAQLVQTQENRQRFMTDIVHNLRSPLFAMGGYLDLLRDEIPEPTKEQEKYLDMLDGKTEYISKMTDDMFLIYRLEDGQLRMDKKSFELGLLLEQICQDAQAKGQEREIRVSLDMEEPDSFLYGDRFRLKQVFDNILDNAIRYSPDRGQIRIRQERVGEENYISVADQGPGISEEQQSRLFERYKSKGEGGKTGLGLSISNSIVQMHDGQIVVTSEPGRGTVMTVVLPCENFNEISTKSLT